MNQKEIIGNWAIDNDEIIPDTNCELIDSMVKNELKLIETSENGWKTLYEGKDGLIWELSYPKSHLNGGGPPKLSQKIEPYE